MPPNAFITHKLPGRARIRVPSHVCDPPYFASTIESLQHLAGIESLEANPVAGSILIRHTGPLEPILDEAGHRGLFAISPPEAPPPDSLVDRVAAGVDRISRFRAPSANLPTAAVGALIAASAVQVLRGKWLPSGFSLAAWAAGFSVLSRK